METFDIDFLTHFRSGKHSSSSKNTLYEAAINKKRVEKHLINCVQLTTWHGLHDHNKNREIGFSFIWISKDSVIYEQAEILLKPRQMNKIV